MKRGNKHPRTYAQTYMTAEGIDLPGPIGGGPQQLPLGLDPRVERIDLSATPALRDGDALMVSTVVDHDRIAVDAIYTHFKPRLHHTPARGDVASLLSRLQYASPPSGSHATSYVSLSGGDIDILTACLKWHVDNGLLDK